MSEPELFGRNLFGEAVQQQQSGELRRKFILPPFSVLDARAATWRERKRAWLATGIKSEVGRQDELVYGKVAKYFDHYRVKEGKKGWTDAAGTSVFDPVLVELAYRWFCPPAGQVLDPFAGGSVRGIVASRLGRRYWGAELRPEQVAANRAQATELLPTAAFAPGELTPVELHDGIWVKRDDLCVVNGARGGKARTCWALAEGALEHVRERGLVTAGSRESPQVELVARMAHALGVGCVAFCPEGDITAGPVQQARALGAKVIQVKPGYNNVIAARAREYADEHGLALIPFGMECSAAVAQTRAQVANLPAEADRIVVPVGSGMSLAGILWGLADAGHTVPVLGVCVGADPAKRLDKWAPPDWRERCELVQAPQAYAEHVEATVGPVQLDPVYEAKAVRYLYEGDLLWCVGHRDGPDAVTSGTLPHPHWEEGDARVVVPRAPQADMILSCPPYGDLERYSDDPADLSTMTWEGFCAGHAEVIAAAVERLRPDSFAVWVVGNFRDAEGHYRDLVGETVRAFNAAGCAYYNEAVLLTPVGTAAMRATRPFLASRKLAKTHQNVLVFCKGSWRAAAQRCEDVEIEI